MSRLHTLFIINLFLFVSCNHQNENPDFSDIDSIIFGHFYGFCTGEQCIEIFKLTDDALYEDISDNYPRWDRYYEGNYIKLSPDKFEAIQSLRESIPDQLFSEQDTVFGSPDAADGGGLYFAIKKDDYSRFWIIDQADNSLPSYLKTFRTHLNESISIINN